MTPGAPAAYWAWVEPALLNFVYFGLLAWLASRLDCDDSRRRSERTDAPARGVASRRGPAHHSEPVKEANR